jgi:uncharacterized damage-inducible protein DinB
MENNSFQTAEMTYPSHLISPESLLEHWQGHRRLTRRVIDVFPEEAFFTFSLGGMRPFSEMVLEMIGIAEPGIQGVATGQWPAFTHLSAPATKKEVLQLWDSVTEQLNTIWPSIPAHRFRQEEKAFGMYTGTILSHLLYFIDNEIHHRGQGYVYLRSLGIEPPAFWERE